ncbi:MAG TPA: CoA pyrophosphatase [Sandaracinaceae bacterium]
MARALHLASILRRLAAAEPAEAGTPPGAAVAAILREVDRGPEILLIRRAEHPGDPWSGHMAFPGGRFDPDDRSLEQTAVRETAEEIGLDLRAHGELVARLDDVPTHTSGLVVRPFVWHVADVPPLVPNHEVADVLWVDLESLVRGERDTTFELEWKGQRHRFPAYQVGDRVVWGLTYRMLRILLSHV